MSGGYFDYVQYRINDLEEGLETILLNKSEDYSEETISKISLAKDFAEVLSLMTQRIDWLVCGDDSEENFHERWTKDSIPSKLDKLNHKGESK